LTQFTSGIRESSGIRRGHRAGLNRSWNFEVGESGHEAASCFGQRMAAYAGAASLILSDPFVEKNEATASDSGCTNGGVASGEVPKLRWSEGH